MLSFLYHVTQEFVRLEPDQMTFQRLPKFLASVGSNL